MTHARREILFIIIARKEIIMEREQYISYTERNTIQNTLES